MDTTLFAFAVLVVAFSTFAHRLGRWNVTAPIAFVVAGSVIGFWIEPPTASEVLWIKPVAETTLALVLFHDAAQVRPRDMAADRGLAARALGIGFPLTVLAGFLAAWALFPHQAAMLSLFVAAALAPTDAGLGAATVLNPVVPTRIRRLLNVESGFNDGLATPVALFAVAALAGSYGANAASHLGEAVVEIVIGVVVGIVVGVGGARLRMVQGARLEHVGDASDGSPRTADRRVRWGAPGSRQSVRRRLHRGHGTGRNRALAG